MMWISVYVKDMLVISLTVELTYFAIFEIRGAPVFKF